MNERNEIAKVLLSTLADISSSEKQKALKQSDYGTAMVLGILEGFFKEAVKSC